MTAYSPQYPQLVRAAQLSGASKLPGFLLPALWKFLRLSSNRSLKEPCKIRALQARICAKICTEKCLRIDVITVILVVDRVSPFPYNAGQHQESNSSWTIMELSWNRRFRTQTFSTFSESGSSGPCLQHLMLVRCPRLRSSACPKMLCDRRQLSINYPFQIGVLISVIELWQIQSLEWKGRKHQLQTRLLGVQFTASSAFFASCFFSSADVLMCWLLADTWEMTALVKCRASSKVHHGMIIAILIGLWLFTEGMRSACRVCNHFTVFCFWESNEVDWWIVRFHSDPSFLATAPLWWLQAVGSPRKKVPHRNSARMNIMRSSKTL